MFEDKIKQRRKRYLILGVFSLLAVGVFGLSFFMNMEPSENALKAGKEGDSKPYANLQIPNSLLNPTSSTDKELGSEVPEIDIDPVTNIADGNHITPDTKLIFSTSYMLCGHSTGRTVGPAQNELGMTRDELQEKYSDWQITSYNTREIVLLKEIESYCPRHYVIGTKDGFVATFGFNENGTKRLIEVTEIPVEVLTPEDQRNLQIGIIADSEDDLEIKLEGFSN